ncbi:alanine/ornithine racemase family PLP-dependent enzyme [Thermosipho atlanticus]|uniref:Predicted amino acid racemase n=1 Tax=Thermosipho atlanticus DSM 15807 TaxID=1123380 RepID=A0A1M5SEF4_9BACT|nr:alanine/ornithine racemase family PLP-dependent enzyme [Thermosipho atlanticus]SHH36658.1 Predicted amino acid racemase [Thermosipho atlanticus DSM 15807]
MSYPRLIIDLEKIYQNALTLQNLCGKNNIELVGVTKLVLGDPKIAWVLKKAGIKILGDSRLSNIKRMVQNNIPGPFQLLRIPMLSEIEEVVNYVDEILVSEEETVLKVEEVAKKYDKNIQIIYMIDVGDLREGIWYEEAPEKILNLSKRLSTVTIRGIGTNLGCFGGVLPTKENMNILVKIKKYLEKKLGKKLIVSGGNTVALKLVESGELPSEINQFRIGEALLLGTDATGHREISYLSQDTVILEAEIIEIDYKPSIPVGKIGRDSMGRIPHFEDKGWRKRLILAMGEQDIDPTGLKPFDKELEILHASSDHTIVDITNSSQQYKLGDIVKFRMSYGCALRAFTSPYIEKIYK